LNLHPTGNREAEGIATIRGLYAFSATYVDLRNTDPFTYQFCPGNYGTGGQTVHAASSFPGRNGGAGLRMTGSPGPIETCPDYTAVQIGADTQTPIFDGEMSYTALRRL
jgi:hypothetical protein